MCMFYSSVGDEWGGDGELPPLAPCTEPLPAPSGKWYVEYYNSDNFECVQDCNGAYPCNGRPSSYKELYNDYETCCEHHTWWNVDCKAYHLVGNGAVENYVRQPSDSTGATNDDGGNSDSGSAGDSWSQPVNQPSSNANSGVGSGSTDNDMVHWGESPAPSNKFFANYQSGSCLQDCEPGPFGCARVPPPIVLYDSIESCCAIGQAWVDGSYCVSRSMGTYTNKFFVSYADSRCIMDCDPADPSCSLTSDHDDTSLKLFDSAEQCCRTLLGWINIDTCVRESQS